MINTGNKIDPVCGMSVSESSEIQIDYNGKKYYFCSEHCRASFARKPTDYLMADHSDRDTKSDSQSFWNTYFPLVLIFLYLLGGTLLIEIKLGNFDGMRMMNHFMGAFFVTFSFFKFLNLSGFVDAYRSYDLLAKAIPLYGWIYPWIELGLGIAYFVGYWQSAIYATTLIVMLISSIGVIQSLLRKKQIQCACLGTVFKLPMTKITLFEDLSMAAMALIGLISLAYK